MTPYSVFLIEKIDESIENHEVKSFYDLNDDFFLFFGAFFSQRYSLILLGRLV